MDTIFEHYKKTGYLHHVYVIEGVHDEVVGTLASAIEHHLGIRATGNPDFAVLRYEAFSIDDARVLKGAQTREAFGGVYKIFIISALSFPPETQNALLKTFEEPTEGTHFFIILPRAEILLPTLRSRVQVVSGTDAAVSQEAYEFAKKFFSATLENRFAMIKKLVEKKDRELFRVILDHVERILREQTKGKDDESFIRTFDELYKTKEYLASRGSSPKMLLEHIAMVI